MGAADQPPGEARRAPPRELCRLEEGVGNLLEGARTRVRRADHDRADEVGRQRPLRPRDRERRGDRTGLEADAEATAHLTRPQQRVEQR